jgi:hypothetical protein
MSDITEYDDSTGETTFRKFIKKEKDLSTSLLVEGQDQIDAINADLEQKFLAKQQAVAALEELGLTEAQAKAVIGI